MKSILGKRRLFPRFVLFFLFLSFAIPLYAQQLNGWQEIVLHTFESAQFLTDQKIIVVGDQGLIRLSSDRGKTWRANNLNENFDLQSVNFIDSLHGIVGASKGQIFSSSDGGWTWVQLKGFPTSWLNKILMVTPDTIFACGISGLLLRSANGGTSWDFLNSGAPFFLRNIYFTSPDNGFVIGDSGIILHTTDAGNLWKSCPTDSNFQLLGIDFLDSLHGAVCGQSGVIYITSDGAKTWNKKFIDTIHHILLSSVSFHSISHLSAIAIGGAFYESNDGGITWNSIPSPDELHGLTITLNGGFRKERDKGWAVGNSGVILLSSDSGRSWQQSASFPVRNTNISRVLFFDSSNGYAVGDNSLLLSTVNGGQTWKSLIPEDLNLFMGIYSSSPDTMWVYGFGGWLIKTYNAWKSWNQDPVPAIPNLRLTNYISINDLYMVTRNIGYLVEDSIIWKTTDAGISWSGTIWHGWRPYIHNLETIAGTLEHIFFLNKDTGFATGWYEVPFDTTQGAKANDYGIMFRTRNGGITWDTLNYGYRNRIYGIYFWDEKNGIITCDSGNVLKTSDDGDSWHLAYQIPNIIPGKSFLSDVNFITAEVGYITVNPPKIFVTTDGGESWSLDIDLSSSNQSLKSLNRIVFPDTNTVMVSGYQGILRKKIDFKKLSVAKTDLAPINYAWITLKQNPISILLPLKLYWLLPTSESLSLKIYDMLGRPMLDFSDELQQANSIFGIDFRFNVSSLSNGVYLLVLNAGGFVRSERFVVMK